MPEVRGTLHPVLIFCLVALTLAAAGCEETPEIRSGASAVTAGGMEFELGDYHIRYLELTDADGDVIEFPSPVLAIELTMTNTGEDQIVYNPTHGESVLSERSTPLLYPTPTPSSDGEIDWENFEPEPIAGILLHQAQWEEQLQESQTLAPGDSITDIFIFQVPEAGQSDLVFSIPPAMHRGELPVMLRFDYQPREPRGPALYGVGDEIDFDGLTFAVTEVSQEYLALEDESQGEGFTAEPILKVSYSLTNNSDEPLAYDPAHRNMSGDEGAVLKSQDVDFRRYLFPSTALPEGQQDGSVDIEPDETIEDFAAFERPDEAADAVTFILPAPHFSRSGRVRVGFSYAPEDVEVPEELREDDEDEDDSDE